MREDRCVHGRRITAQIIASYQGSNLNRKGLTLGSHFHQPQGASRIIHRTQCARARGFPATREPVAIAMRLMHAGQVVLPEADPLIG